jgi:Flp pilus assembly secretin CpaC
MMVTIRTAVFILALTGFATTSSLVCATDRTIILRLGVETPLLLEKPFETVIIGDPRVVDVITRGDRSIILQPLALGSANVIFLDNRSIVTANIGILVCKAIASRIADLDEPVCDQIDSAATPPT